MVGQIKAYRFSNRFEKQYKTLPSEIRQAFKEKLDLFLTDMLHPSPSLLRILGPMIRRNGACIDGHDHAFGFFDRFQKLFHSHYIWRKSPIKTHHKQWQAIAGYPRIN